MLSPLAAPVPISSERALPPLPALELPGPIAQPATQAYRPYTPASVSHRPVVSPTIVSPPSIGSFPTHGSSTIPPTISPAPSSSSTLAPVQRAPSAPGVRSRTPAPYRPGFQPKGVYRPRTDEFLEARKQRNDQDRVERTRLERRLEKLISLHFPHPDQKKEKDSLSVRPGPNRRASSFFDIDISTLKGKSAGDLWKGVVQAQAAGGKNDIRALVLSIFSRASFHPLTNRKHHCRLCGRIICSLPVKYPQRSQSCSLLFVADPLTGQVEEVGEGVDYGVRRRTNSMGPNSVKGKGRDDAFGLNEDEKFLKGVRICRDCRPVLQRRRYTQEAHTVPLFTRLYEASACHTLQTYIAFVQVEKEIEETLPQFQELMLSLNNDERPSPEASLARKRLLEAFAQYDALAKRIRKLPCQGGPGGSQDRVQQAIVTRANIFLQKNMFPLQAMPKPQKASAAPSPTSESPKAPSPPVDPDSEVAKALQPLLEQEALLESFVEEAKAQRKFEDVQALKTSLIEIRTEIDRILAAADGGLSEHRPTPGRKTR
ncbi:hypothetical protein PHLGIDRAFT_69866 [Phlebiopsis gigantea 11061_1 CR5-6]|uniref:FYVE zinc finger domain-containing protein n=1 Tax=Phlebiopsis gigantea (strain 11061_1 CR5-6) TaxID=745531 RepID=A0A0C3S030_PHLG1|nr:hypothetical protein PHLGIDRAFT_69866 [Phlebiopsis gigantea 11061_1 CR5-6]